VSVIVVVVVIARLVAFVVVDVGELAAASIVVVVAIVVASSLGEEEEEELTLLAFLLDSCMVPYIILSIALGSDGGGGSGRKLVVNLSPNLLHKSSSSFLFLFSDGRRHITSIFSAVPRYPGCDVT